MSYRRSKQTSRLLHFDQIHRGAEAEWTHRLTQADVDAFAQLTGDANPLHLDEAFARRAGFRQPVVYGMLSASFISTLIGMVLPGRGALWTKQTLEFLHPAHVGDTLCVRAQVRQKSPATRTIVLAVEITNQHEQAILTGEATVRMPAIQEEQEMTDETGQVILVTGGSGGIGAAIAHQLARAGHTVIVHYARAESAARQVIDEIDRNGGRALPVQADLADDTDVQRLFATTTECVGPVQAVVHCAAPANALRAFDELTWPTVQQQLDVQVKGAFQCAQAALPAMLDAGAGAFVFIGSVASDGPPPGQQTDYVLAKAALTSLARSLAVEYGPRGIRANVVAPGMTQTDRITHLPDKAKLLTRMQTPLRRLAEPDDIAAVAAFLLSPGARHITGETIRVSGGLVMA